MFVPPERGMPCHAGTRQVDTVIAMRQAPIITHRYIDIPDKKSYQVYMLMPQPDPPDSIVPASEAALSTELQSAVERTREFVAQSVADNTRRAYASDWSLFTAWCNRVGLASMPADPSTVAMYASELASGTAFPDECPSRGPRKASTVKRHLASISVAHRTAKHVSPLDSELVKHTLTGIQRALGTRPEKKAPALAEMVARMVATRDPNAGDATRRDMATRDIAMVLVGFGGAMRRSEVVALDLEDVEFRPEGLAILIRRSKGDQAGEGRTVRIPLAGNPRFCASIALREWLHILAGYGVTSGAIFRSLSRRNRGERLSPEMVANAVKTLAEKVGEDPKRFGGHSLRSGHATSAARAGKRVDVIRAQTGHRHLDTLMSYIRDETGWSELSGEGLL
jgi:integrase